MAQTLFDKVWQTHVIAGEEGESQLLYIDLHLIHEVTSPQGFSSLKEQDRPLRAPEKTLATIDHNNPTKDIYNIQDIIAKKQIETLEENCDYFGVELMDYGSEGQGIVHMIGPETGATQPGKTIVCGDSHTATHGACGAIAFGIGSSEVEHVFATQSLWQKKPKTLGIKITGDLQEGVYSKDIMLHLFRLYGTDFGQGHAIEFYGPTVENLSMEARMTMCNLGIEFGSKYALIAPDQKTFDHLQGRAKAPADFDRAVDYWQTLYTDEGAAFDKTIELDVSDLEPYITWGTTPAMGIGMSEKLPQATDAAQERAYDYMDLQAGMSAGDIPVSNVFLGSCTNARLEDLIEGAKYIKGRQVQEGVYAVVVPGSRTVKHQAEELGIAQMYKDAGFEWREPGCSACISMNGDRVPAGVHCASTTNRNFEGRQGPGSRTHLCSPAVAVLAAIKGQFYDPRKDNQEVAIDHEII